MQRPQKRKRRSIIRRLVDKWHELLSKISPWHRVRRSVIADIQSQPNTLRVKTTNVTINGLQSYEQYTVTIQAVNSGGKGPAGLAFPKTLFNGEILNIYIGLDILVIQWLLR